MAYLASIHPPSSVRHALRLNFLDPDEESLVVAKSNRLELYAHTQDGLVLKHSRAVYGRVTMLDKVRPASAVTDHLFVGTDRSMYFVVSWDAATKQLRTERSFVDQADHSSRESQTGDRCAIDSTGSFMALEIYEGVVNVIPIVQKQRKTSDPELGTLLDPIPVRIPEMFVRSSAFLETRVKNDDKPKIALLYEDAQRRVKLKLRELDYQPGLPGSDDAGSAELKDLEGLQEELELGVSHLIPVPAPACGLIILAETSLMYYEHSSQDRIRRPLRESTVFVAWERIDTQRFILADDYGKLYLLMLEADQYGKVSGWQLDILGETSRASVLVYLGNGLVFVGSHQGDSQVIAIKPQAIEVQQTFANIAPILDFSIMDLGNRSAETQTTNEFSSGQARLVTGSGAYKDGSLRSVRSGVGLEDLGLLDALENVTDMFSVKSNPSDTYADALVVAFINETRVFHFSSDGEVEELEQFKGFKFDEGTLLASNVAGGQLLQVTSSAVRLIDPDSSMTSAEWTAPLGQSITTVSASQDTAVVSIGGLSLISLDLTSDLKVLAERQFGADQIACIGVSPSGYPYCIVGFWQSNSISVLDLRSLKNSHTEEIGSTDVSVPRSVLLVDALDGQPPTLFLALADGNIVTYNFNLKTGALVGKKSVVLGTQEATLKALPRGNGLYNVFAACEQSSLIYGSEGRLVFSAITVEKASCVCPFDAEAYPGAIAVAAEEGLKIALIDEERSTHVQGLQVGETVRRIAYSTELKAFGLGTINRTLENGVETIESSFKLTDEVMFQVQATFPLNTDELVESVMRCPLNDGSGGKAERFVVGTAFLDDEHGDSVRGRILVLEVTEDRSLKLVTEHFVKGACRCLAPLGDRIVAALIKTVVVYSLDYETPSSPVLTKRASYRTATAPVDLSIDAANNRIAVADLMKSVSILEYRRSGSSSSSRPDTLTEVARHFQTSWSTAVAQVSSLEDDPAPLLDSAGRETPAIRFLEADAEGNLLLLNQNTDAVTAEDRRRLTIMSELNLGEMVNRIRPVHVPVVAADAAVIPRAFLATTEGSIYLFALIAPKRRDLLMRLQAELADVVHSPGDVPFMLYRGYRSLVRREDEPVRFVDGDLVEQFLNAPDELQAAVAKNLKEDVESLRALIEGLRRLR